MMSSSVELFELKSVSLNEVGNKSLSSSSFSSTSSSTPSSSELCSSCSWSSVPGSWFPSSEFSYSSSSSSSSSPSSSCTGAISLSPSSSSSSTSSSLGTMTGGVKRFLTEIASNRCLCFGPEDQSPHLRSKWKKLVVTICIFSFSLVFLHLAFPCAGVFELESIDLRGKYFLPWKSSLHMTRFRVLKICQHAYILVSKTCQQMVYSHQSWIG